MDKNKNIAIESKEINLLDLFRYLVSYWKWYLLSVFLFTGYYIYDYSRTSFCI